MAAHAEGYPASVADPDICDGIGTVGPMVPLRNSDLKPVCGRLRHQIVSVVRNETC